jgi:hypothetical protein
MEMGSMSHIILSIGALQRMKFLSRPKAAGLLTAKAALNPCKRDIFGQSFVMSL